MAIISQGQVRVTGDPRTVIQGVQGRIWQTTIDKSALNAYQRDHAVISTRWQSGRLLLHVLADEAPDTAFEPVAANLEDVYFATLNHGEAA
jgi:hypothetical protein